MQTNKSVDLSLVGDLGGIDVKDLIIELIRKWYIIVFFLSIGIGTAYYVHKNAKVIYEFSSTLLVIPKRTGSKMSSIDEVLDESFFSNNNRNINDEIGLIKSVDNIAAAVRKLNLQFEFYSDEDFKKDEYINPMLNIVFDSVKREDPLSIFRIKFVSDQEYNITEIAEKKAFPKNLLSRGDNTKRFSKTLKYGQIDPILGWGIVLSNSGKELIGKTYYLSLAGIAELSQEMQIAVSVEPSVKEANLLSIGVDGSPAEKMIDFLNVLMQEYMKADLEEKNRQGRLTSAFLEKQIRDAKTEMDLAESVLEQYKSEKRLPDVSITTSILSRNLNDLELQRENVGVMLQQYQTIYTSLADEDVQISVPSHANMGRQEEVISDLLRSLNVKIRERALLKNVTNNNNIQARQLDVEIESIRKSIKEYVSNSISSAKSLLAKINGDITKLQEKLANIPYEYHQVEDLTREYNFQREQLQLLLGKLENTNMRLATNVSDCRVVDVAHLGSKVPVAPNGKLIYMIGFGLGAIIPVFLILLIRLIKDKVNRENDITRNTPISIIAVIPQTKKKKGSKAVSITSRSLLSESFNLLAIELKQMLVEQKTLTIGLTSMVGKEGKTFCATHLAVAFAGHQYKTLLIYFDLYKDEPSVFEGVTNHLGMGDYLTNNAQLFSIIQPSGINGLDVITQGSVKKNPLQLLQATNLDEMLIPLKEQYEIIIIDTPPVGIISDYLVLEPFVDVTLNVVKYNETPVPFLSRLNQMTDKGLIRNPHIIFNGVNSNMMPEIKFIQSNKYLLHYYRESN